MWGRVAMTEKQADDLIALMSRAVVLLEQLKGNDFLGQNLSGVDGLLYMLKGMRDDRGADTRRHDEIVHRLERIEDSLRAPRPG
jgi:hypothetical protein